jgi:hypothetical protein
MKYTKAAFIGLFALASSSQALAADCPNLAGDYVFSEVVGDVGVSLDLNIDQVRCELLFVRTRTSTGAETVRTYRLDGIFRGTLNTSEATRAEKRAIVETQVTFSLQGPRSRVTRLTKGRDGDVTSESVSYDSEGRETGRETTILRRR